VLNAKRHQRLGQPSTSHCSCSGRCAQRQKASKVGTVSSVSSVGFANTVLNAKRHQRLGQTGESAATRPGEPCAQRQKASKVGTGVGLIGLWFVCTVLNAKRHQRLGQNLSTVTLAGASTVLNAKRHQRLGQCFVARNKVSEANSAQRQKASKVGTVLNHQPGNAFSLVLNAKRHQRLGQGEWRL